MFTQSDLAFLDRLDQRAESALGSLDDPLVRLHRALAALGVLVAHPDRTTSPDAVEPMQDLLDDVWLAAASHDATQARSAANRLQHAVRGLPLDGLLAWRAASVTLEIRSLVVLAA